MSRGRTKGLLVAVTALAAATLRPLPAHATVPGFGGQVAFWRSGELWVAGIDGTASPIAPLTPDAGLPRAAWSPDGTRLAYEDGPATSRDIYVINADGTGRANLTNSPEVEGWPTWSPDGANIAYQRSAEHVFNGSTTAPIYATEIWAMTSTGANRHLVARGGSRPEDDHLRYADALSPDWSPDGRDIAFEYVDPVTTNRSDIAVVPAVGGLPTLLTSSDDKEVRRRLPAWSPRGDRLAFAEGDSLKTVPASGGSLTDLLASVDPSLHRLSWSGDARWVLTGRTDLLFVVAADGSGESDDLPAEGRDAAWQSTRVVRLSGPDRIATSIEISSATWGEGEAQGAVVATSQNYPDALAGTPLAVAAHGPLLLTARDELDDRVAAELQRAVRQAGTVYVLGGRAALADTVEHELRALGFSSVRVSGPSRYDTAVRIAQALPPPQRLLLATGNDFPAALIAGVAAASVAGAILLTDGASMPPATQQYLDSHPEADVTAIGADAASAAPGAAAIAAPDRYALSVAVAQEFFEDPELFSLASGINYPDALAGGASSAIYGAPLLLTDPGALPAPVAEYLEQTPTLQHGAAFGGTAAIREPVIRQVNSTIYRYVEPAVWFGTGD